MQEEKAKRAKLELEKMERKREKQRLRRKQEKADKMANKVGPRPCPWRARVPCAVCRAHSVHVCRVLCAVCRAHSVRVCCVPCAVCRVPCRAVSRVASCVF